MILVVGSRHDPVATALADRWPDGRLCSAEDLTAPGWVWPVAEHGLSSGRTWVVGGHPVADTEVSGVFLRRSAVHPEELTGIHPDDRAYVAAEVHAFLVFVLATTSATVTSPVLDGGVGDETLRPERWMAAAHEADVGVAPLRLRSAPSRRRPLRTRTIEVVGDAVVGAASPRTASGLRTLAAALGLSWGAFVVDGHHRLVTVSTTSAPSDKAAVPLGVLLGRRAA